MPYDDNFTWRPSPPPPPRRPPAPLSQGGGILLVALTALFTVGLVFGVQRAWDYFSTRNAPPAAPRVVTPRGELADAEKTTIAIYNNAKASVVHITTLTVRRDVNFNVQEVPEGTGSGFIWDDQGHVVTNYHVVENARRIAVNLWDQSSYYATVVGTYPDKDIAVLKIDAPRDKLRPIPIGTSSDLQVGQMTFAIGNPFGLDHTLTTGVVSALGRQIESVTKRSIRDVIQTDAAINPGNSGGPLLDSAGRLIGMNTAIFSRSGMSGGIGFAIPVDEINRVAPELIRDGKVTRPSLGVQVASDQLAQQLRQTGAVVLAVTPGSAAEEVGLRGAVVESDGKTRLGDVIVALDGHEVKKVNDLFDGLERCKPGATVKVTVLRAGQKIDVEATLHAAS
jgi:S1-C subfamily serine protease